MGVGDVSLRNQELTRMLEDKKQSIVSLMHGKVAAIRRTDGNRHGDLPDQAGNTVPEFIDLTMVRMKRDELLQIDEALKALSEGRYGICTDCGEEIAQKRLAALPFTIRCKRCAEQQDEQNSNGRSAIAGGGYYIR
jgi:DnaK suppressor protein